jgi:hypothetical protein
MATPSYSTDLQDINLAEGDTWIEMSTHKSGSDPVFEQDYYIQGTGCCSQATGASTGTQAGMAYDYGTLVQPVTDGCFFIWQILLAGNNIYSFAEGGMRFYIGSADGNWNGYKTSGDNFGRNPYGGWYNAAIYPLHQYDYQEGTPTAGLYRWFASLPNIRLSMSKGNPHAVDALRYGRGTLTVSGGDLANGYATFEGMAAENDIQDNRWGLFQSQAGSYLWKGLMSLGEGDTWGPVDFRDSNRNIIADIVVRTYPEFNKIEIRNASSRVDWTGINISSLPPSGYYSPGDFEVVENADVNIDSCSFTDMGEFTFQSNSTIDSTAFRRCLQVDWGNALFDGCTFETTRASAALYTEDLTDIDNCTFTGGDEGNNAIHMSASGSYTFIGNTFTGYGASGSPSAAIYHDSGGHLTINVQNGDSPTVYDVGSSTSEVNNPVILTLSGLVSGSEVRIYEAGTITELDGVEDSTTSFDYPYTYVAETYVDIVVHHVDYVYYRIEAFLLPGTSGSIPIQQQYDRWYSNP